MRIVEDGDKTKFPTAVSMLNRAIASAPDLAFPHANMGITLYRWGKFHEAEPWIRRAIEMEPSNASFHGNMGTWASALGHDKEAEFHLSKAMELQSDDSGPRWDRALLYLRQDWKRGLDEYECRFDVKWKKGEVNFPGMPMATWEGQPLDGKTIYVQGEQGAGDRILFSRYLFELKKRWPSCRVLCCLGDDMINLMYEYRKAGIEFLPNGVPWPDNVNYGIWLMSLPRLLDYVKLPDPGYIKQRMMIERTGCQLPEPDLPSMKIGIAWTGNPGMRGNANRSVPLPLMLSLAEDPRVQLYSFQVGPGRREFEQLGAKVMVVDLADELEKSGWMGTALALSQCDLVITVCTSIAHLAGSLHTVPVWTLLCADAYWIWERSDGPTCWYPNMKLFRQEKLGEWKPVIERVKRKLSKHLEVIGES